MSTTQEEFTSADEYRQLTARVMSGDLIMVISPSVARQFYTHIPNSEIVNKTGDSQLLAKLAVWAGLIAAPMLFLLSLTLLYLADGWSSVLYITIGGSLWVVITAFISPEGNNVVYSTITTLATILAGVIYLSVPHVSDFYLVCFLYISSIWTHHLTYLFAAFRLRKLVLNSAVAYDMLREHIKLTDASK